MTASQTPNTEQESKKAYFFRFQKKPLILKVLELNVTQDTTAISLLTTEGEQEVIAESELKQFGEYKEIKETLGEKLTKEKNWTNLSNGVKKKSKGTLDWLKARDIIPS